MVDLTQANFVKGLLKVYQIELKEMLLPLVIGVQEEDPDYTLTVERLKKCEINHGTIPAGAVVALRIA